jgi:hypothetical protein
MPSIQPRDPRGSGTISQAWESASSDHVLSSWKEIAAFFGKGVRTVQRWEQELNLPVRRPNGDKQIIFAKVLELEGWLNRHVLGAQPSANPSRRNHRKSQAMTKANSGADVQRIRELAESIRDLAERAARIKRTAI